MSTRLGVSRQNKKFRGHFVGNSSSCGGVVERSITDRRGGCCCCCCCRFAPFVCAAQKRGRQGVRMQKKNGRGWPAAAAAARHHRGGKSNGTINLVALQRRRGESSGRGMYSGRTPHGGTTARSKQGVVSFCTTPQESFHLYSGKTGAAAKVHAATSGDSGTPRCNSIRATRRVTY